MIDEPDPFIVEPSTEAKDGDYVLLHFSDNRQIFAQVLSSWRGKTPPLKMNKRNYSTSHLIGLPYGSVLELDHKKGLIPLKDGEDIMPIDEEKELLDSAYQNAIKDQKKTEDESNEGKSNDNRNIFDNNTSQSLKSGDLRKMRSDPTISGSSIVKKIIESSSTFAHKTEFSKAKYVRRKQMKYQPRCRMVKCTPPTICAALFDKDRKKIMNLREDSLAQILSYGNISAGRKVLVFDTCFGVVTGSILQRMAGYGLVYALYAGHAPPFVDWIARFNLSFCEYNNLKWIHCGQVFNDDSDENRNQDDCKLINIDNDDTRKEKEDLIDYEKQERDQIKWPCELLPHTSNYVKKMPSDDKRIEFLNKRCSRFSRKLTRPTHDENLDLLKKHVCDSLILSCQYDPASTLLNLFPYLLPSCPFVVFYEYMEPLVECFKTLQEKRLAINLRLCDTWMREYQVLPGRTHPNMNMSQNGGFILTGVKLCPRDGINELDEELAKKIRAEVGGRRGKKKRQTGNKEGASKKKAKKGK